MTSLLDISTTSPHEWKYISEGGSSIVFSYTGPSHASFDGTALRLRKASHSSLTAPTSPVALIQQVEDPDDPAIAFQHEVVARVLPEEYLPRLEAVQVSRGWLEELTGLTEERRPEERRAKDSIDVHKARAVLATDLVGGRAIAVEIKVRLSPPSISPQSSHRRAHTAKVGLPPISLAPLDGHGVGEDDDVPLLHACAPEKRARRGRGRGVLPAGLVLGRRGACAAGAARAVGRVGQHVGRDEQLARVRGGAYAEAERSCERFPDVCGAVLIVAVQPSSIQPLASRLHLPDDEAFTLFTVRDAFVSRVLPLLLESSLLRILSNLQRTLDPLDIEGLSLLWSRAYASQEPGVALETHSPDGDAPSAPPLGSGLSDPTVDGWKQFLEIYLAKNSEMDHDHPDIANLQYYCFAYLLSATFKDCSLILRIPEEGRGSITVIDLDVKPIDRLQKWEKLDKEIVEAYKNAWKPKQCVALESTG